MHCGLSMFIVCLTQGTIELFELIYDNARLMPRLYNSNNPSYSQCVPSPVPAGNQQPYGQCKFDVHHVSDIAR